MLHPINWSLALPYYLAALTFGYLIGSIPFGVVLTRLAGTAFAAIWVIGAALTRYSSLASLVACAATPVVLWASDDRQEAVLFVLLTVLVFLIHRANIVRLATGNEAKIGGSGGAS